MIIGLRLLPNVIKEYFDLGLGHWEHCHAYAGPREQNRRPESWDSLPRSSIRVPVPFFAITHSSYLRLNYLRTILTLQTEGESVEYAMGRANLPVKRSA